MPNTIKTPKNEV